MRGPRSERGGDEVFRQAYSESCNIVLSEWLWHGAVVPPYVLLCFLKLQLPSATCRPEADDSPLTQGQKVNSGLTQHHNTAIIHLVSSHL